MSYMRLPTRSEGKLPSIPSLTEEEGTIAPIEVTTWKCRRQLIGTLIICLGIFGVGTMFGWGAVVVPVLKIKGKISRNPATEAAVASLFIIGAMFAGPPAGYLMFKIGRKLSIFLFAVLFTASWILIITAEVTENETAEGMLCAGRFLTGFAGAGSLVIGPVYVRELCNEKVRTMMCSLVPLLLMGGATYCFALGSVMEWWVLSITCGAFPFLQCFVIFLMPDSPRYLLTIGKNEEARKAIFWLSSGFTPEEKERLFKREQRAVEFLSGNTNRAMKRSERRKQEKRKTLSIKSKVVITPLIISIFLMFFQQGSGANVVTAYTKEILDRGSNFLPAETGLVIVGILFFLCVLLATFIVERLGRKPLLLGGFSTMFITQIVLGVYFYYDDDKETHDLVKQNYSWMPIISVIIFSIGYCTGPGPVTWIIATEINHPDFQEVAGTLGSFTYWGSAFMSMMTLPNLREAIGYHWCFWMYSIISFIAFWFVFFFVYETKGKTTEQIIAHYKGTTYDPAMDEDEDTESIGSIIKKNSKSRGKPRFSTDSDDLSTDFETIFEHNQE